jgi:hypothetical protein
MAFEASTDLCDCFRKPTISKPASCKSLGFKLGAALLPLHNQVFAASALLFLPLFTEVPRSGILGNRTSALEDSRKFAQPRAYAERHYYVQGRFVPIVRGVLLGGLAYGDRSPPERMQCGRIQ